MSKIVEGDHFELLMSWSENEDVKLPEGMEEYVKQLEFARGFIYSGSTPPQAARKLRIHWSDLTFRQARSRVADAVEYFYIDEDLKKEAYRKIHYEKQIQMAQLVIRMARCSADIKIASEIYEKAGRARQLHLPDKEELPPEMFEKKWRIYTLDTGDVGLPDIANRNLLSEWIDDFNITEEQKLTLKQDAGIEPRKILDFDGEEESDT